MRVTAVLKGHTDKMGRQSIYIRISENSKRIFRITQMKVKPNEWDAGTMTVTGHPQAKNFNQKIRSLIIRVESELLEGVSRFKDGDFFDYYEHCMSEWKDILHPDTLRQYRSDMNKAKDFSGPVLLSDVSPKWLRDFQKYCQNLGNAPNTVWKTFKHVKTVIKHALKEKIIQDNPFDIFEMPPYRDPQRVYLSEEEIGRIEELSGQDHEYTTAATWFAIGCYTGLRFGDMRQFSREKNIVNGRLIVTTAKTKDMVSMPLNSKLTTLFERVGYKPLPYTNEHYNRLLKAVATVCNINKVLSSHIARHTFGTLALTKGMPVEVVSKLMSHKSIRTTQIYAKITNPKVDAEYKKLFE